MMWRGAIDQIQFGNRPSKTPKIVVPPTPLACIDGVIERR
jgi:hypothetical protein